MFDLGAGINFMPTFIYNNLDLSPLQHIGLIIQLENISNALLELFFLKNTCSFRIRIDLGKLASLIKLIFHEVSD